MSALQLGKWSQTVVQNTNFQRWYHCQLCLGLVSIAAHPQSVILDTVSLSAHSRSVVWAFTKFLVWWAKPPCAHLPGGMGKDALLRSTCHLLLSSRRLHKLYGEGFIWEDEMDFAIQCSYRTSCVWACVFVHVFSDPLLLSDIPFPLSIWQLRLYLPLGRLFRTQETSFTNKQHLGSIWEMLPLS